MKSKLLLVLLFVSSFMFAQNWSQVGATQFATNFVINSEMAFDNTGTPFVVYEVPSNDAIYVMKFDGTNWVSVGSGAISTENYNDLAINFNRTTNEPWIALKAAASGSASNIDVYRFDGTSWVSEGADIGGGFYNYGIQLQFDDANGTPRLAGVISDGGTYRRAQFFTKSGSNWTASLGHTGISARIDLFDFDSYTLADSSGRVGYGEVGGGTSYFTTSTNLYREVSGNSDYIAANDITNSTIHLVYNPGFGITMTQPTGVTGNTHSILKFRESLTDENHYLMYSDNTENLSFQKYKPTTNSWSTIPSIGIATNTTDFFVKMEINPVNGSMYVLYKDGGKMSLKKFNVQAPLNLARIYVDVDATGNNDGSSWANAYTSLQDALNNIYANTTEIWVAEGSYTPDASDRTKSFTISKNDLEIYGGFNGTETTLADRDLQANYNTILSGDLNRDDTAVTLSNGSGRAENSFHVVKITGHNIILDGVTIEDGHARGSSSNAYGAAVFITDTVSAITFKNCEFNKNVGSTGGAIRVSFDANAAFTIENCKFDNNLSRYGSGVYLLVNNNRTVTVNITNTLFSNNESKDLNGSSKGYTGSAMWLRANGTGSTLTSTITNCTFANNTDIGTQSGSEKGTLALGKRTDDNSTHNANINNSILYGNTVASGTPKSVNYGHTSGPNFTYVNNSIGEDSFSNLTYLTNTSGADPLFTNAANNDLTLQTGSPAIDTGDNSKIPTGITTDLVGNARIYNTSVDMGCYEFDPAFINYYLTVNATNGVVTPTSGAYQNGSQVTITVTPNAGYLFSEWTGDATGNTNPLTITMDANKTITAVFETLPTFVDASASGNNDGTSWADAFTNLQTAIDNTATTEVVWVKAGTYTPGTQNTSTFLIEDKIIKIYGGFNGTETSVSQRDIKANVTILSGDLDGNDNGSMGIYEGSKADNAYHIITLKGAFAAGGFLDGFTISGANAKGNLSNSCSTPRPDQYDNRVGGAIYSNPDDASLSLFFKIKNSILEHNIGKNDAVFGSFNPCGAQNTVSDVEFISCIVRNNHSENRGNITYSGSQQYHVKRNGAIINSLFYGNTTNGAAGIASVLWLNSGGSASYPTNAANVDIINSTFGTNDANNKPIKISMYTKAGSLRNTIVYGDGNSPLIETDILNYSNNLIEGGQLSSINTNVNFVDATNNVYVLQSNSPAIDTGDNSYLSATITTDIYGDARIYNTIVDLGCYEYSPNSTASIKDEIQSEFSVYPNPVNEVLNIKLAENNFKSAEIYTLLGRKVLISTTTHINVFHLSKGIYLVKVKNTLGQIAIKKFIKK